MSPLTSISLSLKEVCGAGEGLDYMFPRETFKNRGSLPPSAALRPGRAENKLQRRQWPWRAEWGGPSGRDPPLATSPPHSTPSHPTHMQYSPPPGGKSGMSSEARVLNTLFRLGAPGQRNTALRRRQGLWGCPCHHPSAELLELAAQGCIQL